MLSLTSLGAAGMIAGSKHLIHHDEGRLLVDCGLFRERTIWACATGSGCTFRTVNRRALVFSASDHVNFRNVVASLKPNSSTNFCDVKL